MDSFFPWVRREEEGEGEGEGGEGEGEEGEEEGEGEEEEGLQVQSLCESWACLPCNRVWFPLKVENLYSSAWVKLCEWYSIIVLMSRKKNIIIFEKNVSKTHH